MDTQTAQTSPLQAILAAAQSRGIQLPTAVLNQISAGAPQAASTPAPMQTPDRRVGGIEAPQAKPMKTPPSEAEIITKALIERQKRIGDNEKASSQLPVQPVVI